MKKRGHDCSKVWLRKFIIDLRKRTARGILKGSNWVWPADWNWTRPWEKWGGEGEQERREGAWQEGEPWTKWPGVSQEIKWVHRQNGWVIHESKARGREVEVQHLGRRGLECSAGRSHRYRVRPIPGFFGTWRYPT